MSILVGGKVPEIELTSALLQPGKFLRYLETSKYNQNYCLLDCDAT